MRIYELSYKYFGQKELDEKYYFKTIRALIECINTGFVNEFNITDEIKETLKTKYIIRIEPIDKCYYNVLYIHVLDTNQMQ